MDREFQQDESGRFELGRLHAESFRIDFRSVYGRPRDSTGTRTFAEVDGKIRGRLEETRPLRFNRDAMPTPPFRFAVWFRLGIMAAFLIALAGWGDRSVDPLTDVAFKGPASEQEKAALELAD